MARRELGFAPTSIRLIGETWNDPRRLVAISDIGGTTSAYVDVNPASTRILGYTRDEFLEMRPGDLLDDPQKVAGMLAELAEGHPVRATVDLRHRDGHRVRVTIWVYRTRVGDRELTITISHPIDEPPPTRRPG
jgi:PAS domain S-box-containing protein